MTTTLARVAVQLELLPECRETVLDALYVLRRWAWTPAVQPLPPRADRHPIAPAKRRAA